MQFAALLLVGLAACSNDAVAPFALANPPTELVPGVELDVSGRGCPPEGPVELTQNEQVGVELLPVESGSGYDQLGGVNGEGKLGFIGYVGTTEVYVRHFAVDERGEWTGSLPVPDHFAAGDWRLLATCLTLVEESATANPPGMPPAEGTTLTQTFTVG